MGEQGRLWMFENSAKSAINYIDDLLLLNSVGGGTEEQIEDIKADLYRVLTVEYSPIIGFFAILDNDQIKEYSKLNIEVKTVFTELSKTVHMVTPEKLNEMRVALNNVLEKISGVGI